MESIEGNFEEGIPYGHAIIQWSSMKGEILLQQGVPNGFYRVEREKDWAVGHFVDGLVKGPCWIISEGSVRFNLYSLLK